jgi:myo-inositol 2-dehydrogenase/D-chiro-inositol 1-dehydrogenase
MLIFSQFGAGRIGQIHAANIAAHPEARLRYVVDVNRAAAEGLASRYGAAVADTEAALSDSAVDAVLIASSTDTHADLIERAAKAGKAIFCEKPVDLDLKRVDACLKVASKAGVPLLIGFNRRFDPSFATLKRELSGGAIGKLELLAITSRDPGPPPLSYIKVSGGLFRDMMIHDFDLARWILGEEPIEVYATASCLVDPAIGAAGDIDTAVVVLRTKSGAIAQISNSRRAVYGYDQRLEAFGSGGMLRAENRTPTTVERATAEGVAHDKPLFFFLERYAEAYRAELDHFLAAVGKGEPPAPSGADGRAALALAEAALESSRTGKPVKPA